MGESSKDWKLISYSGNFFELRESFRHSAKVNKPQGKN